MNRKNFIKIIFCFLFIQILISTDSLLAEPVDQSLPESQHMDESTQNKRGPGLKVNKIQGKSYTKIEKLSDEDIKNQEKEMEEFLKTKDMHDETSQIDEEKIREQLRKEGKSDKEIDYFIKRYFRGKTDPDEDKEMPEALKTETDQQLHTLWDKMRAALSDNDIETAITCFTEKSRKKYRTIFEKASPENLRQMAEDLEDLQLIKFHSARYAEYDVQNVVNGEHVSWMVIFIKTPWENEWKIKSF